MKTTSKQCRPAAATTTMKVSFLLLHHPSFVLLIWKWPCTWMAFTGHHHHHKIRSTAIPPLLHQYYPVWVTWCPPGSWRIVLPSKAPSSFPFYSHSSWKFSRPSGDSRSMPFLKDHFSDMFYWPYSTPFSPFWDPSACSCPWPFRTKLYCPPLPDSWWATSSCFGIAPFNPRASDCTEYKHKVSIQLLQKILWKNPCWMLGGHEIIVIMIHCRNS